MSPSPEAGGRTTSPRWTVHSALPESDGELRALFQAVFGHAMPSAQWEWKYQGVALRGTLLRRQGRAVAFFGGMPRRFVHAGQVLEAVQNGDVMVLPDERGVFSRPGCAYAFAYGFPSERAFKLGFKLGLYAEAGRMMELRWAPLPAQRHFGWACTPLQAIRLTDLDVLWRRMQRDWPDLYLPVRDAERWRYRYLQHPTQSYVVLVLRQCFKIMLNLIGNNHDFIKAKKLTDFLICIVVEMSFAQVVVDPDYFFGSFERRIKNLVTHAVNGGNFHIVLLVF